jgi:hypothetical protein
LSQHRERQTNAGFRTASTYSTPEFLAIHSSFSVSLPPIEGDLILTSILSKVFLQADDTAPKLGAYVARRLSQQRLGLVIRLLRFLIHWFYEMDWISTNRGHLYDSIGGVKIEVNVLYIKLCWG